MSNVSSSRAVTRLSVQVFVFSMLIDLDAVIFVKPWMIVRGGVITGVAVIVIVIIVVMVVVVIIIVVVVTALLLAEVVMG